MTIYVEIFLVCEGIFMTYVTHDDSEEYYDLNETRYDNLKSRASQLLRNYKDEGFTIPADPVPGRYYNQDTTYEFDAIKGSLDKIESDLRVRKAGKLVDAALIGDEAEVKRLLYSGVKVTDSLPNDPKYKPKDPSKPPYPNAFSCFINKKGAEEWALQAVSVKQGHTPTADAADRTRLISGGLAIDLIMYSAYATELLQKGKLAAASQVAEKINSDILQKFRMHDMPLPDTSVLRAAFLKHADLATMNSVYQQLPFTESELKDYAVSQFKQGKIEEALQIIETIKFDDPANIQALKSDFIRVLNLADFSRAHAQLNFSDDEIVKHIIILVQNNKRNDALKLLDEMDGLSPANISLLKKAFIQYGDAEKLLASQDYLKYEQKDFTLPALHSMSRCKPEDPVVALLSSPMPLGKTDATLAERYQARCEDLMTALIAQVTQSGSAAEKRSVAVGELLNDCAAIKTGAGTASERLFSMLEKVAETHNAIRNSAGGAPKTLLGREISHGSTTADKLGAAIDDIVKQMGVPSFVTKDAKYQITLTEPKVPLELEEHFGTFKAPAPAR